MPWVSILCNHICGLRDRKELTKYQNSLANGTTTLRRLEKKLRDEIINELMAGLVDKKEIDHEDLLLRVGKIHTEISAACTTIMREYRKTRYNIPPSLEVSPPSRPPQHTATGSGELPGRVGP